MHSSPYHRTSFFAGITASLIFVFLPLFLVSSVFSAQAQVGENEVQNRRTILEGELAALEKEIEEQQGILANKQRESVSLERDIAILDAEIAKAQLSIKARNLSIRKLEGEIAEKSKTIGVLSEKIGREKDSLAQLLRKAEEIDSYSLVEVVLAGQDVSDFFADVDAIDSIQRALQVSFAELQGSKKVTEEEKTLLEGKRDEELELRGLQELEAKKFKQKEEDKKEILSITKGVEREYQKVIQAKRKSATAIRSELFMLRGTDAIPFERALELANKAAVKTGIRPAFLLGIIAEESNLGQNVGTGNWRIDMKAPRDTVPFLKITASLGLDPDKMPVSKKAWYGYGGAMGPAQFIPSTWALYAGYESKNGHEYNSSKDRIGSLTGNQPPNPWDPEDAFMASAILLTDHGADQKTYAAERRAALCYLAGCSNAGKSAYAFYGDDVMELADKYQKQIDILAGNP